MAKKLKIWNGRGHIPNQHLYVCAYTKKHLIEIVNEALNKSLGTTDYKYISMHEVNTYWSAGCWGVKMDGIEPEVGVWECFEHLLTNNKVRRIG